MSAGAAAAVVQRQRRNESSAGSGTRRIVEGREGVSAEEAAELAAIEEEAKGQVAERTMGVYEEKAQGKAGRITKKPSFIIDPRTNKYMGYWDGLSMLALVFTAIVTVVEVAFVEPTGQADPLFILNRCIDVIFIIDMIMQFFLMYPKAPKNPNETVRWVHDCDKIAKNYLQSWFPLDLLSTLASGPDFLSLDIVTGGGEQGGSDTGNLKILRVVRVARLIKLVRLVRSSRIIKRWESRMAINYGHLALGKTLIILLLSGHWYACIWGLMCTFQSPKDHWYTNFGYCSFTPTDGGLIADLVAAGNSSLQAALDAQLDDDSQYECMGPAARYVASLYWAIMTITSIGYGDIAATPYNTAEQAVCTLLMLFGGMIWGSVIATFCGVIANLDPQGTEFRKTMDDLNTFMASQGIPREMRISLREYFHQTKHLQVARANKALIENMSPMLQGQVVWKINERWLKHVWFLRAAEDKFMVQLSLELEAAVFAPAELCPNGHMYISHRGIALYGGKVMTTGKVWGEDMILNSAHLRSKYAARCMTYVEVYMISRDGLLNLAKQFAPTLKIIRRSAFRLAFRREMIRRAQNNIKKRNEEAGIVTAESTANQMLITISSKERHADEIKSDQEAQDKMDRNFEAAQAAAAAAELEEGGAEGVGAPPGTLAPLQASSVSPSASRPGDGPGMGEMLQHLEQQRVAMSSLEIRISKQHEALLKQMEALAARVEAALPSGAA